MAQATGSALKRLAPLHQIMHILRELTSAKMAIRTVGITGANGTIGSVLRSGLADNYEIRSFTLEPADFPCTVADLAHDNEVRGLFNGLDAVIHLAADPSPSAPWESVRENNIEATFQVFEECRRVEVQRLVLATTNHTQHGNSLLTTPETLDPSYGERMAVTDPPNPDSLYAISKLFGEHLGKLYSEQHRLSFVGLRIGWIVAEDDPTTKADTKAEAYMRAMFLSHRDCLQAFTRALEVEARFLLAYAISDNERRVFDLQATREQLGFWPRDNAETYFS